MAGTTLIGGHTMIQRSLLWLCLLLLTGDSLAARRAQHSQLGRSARAPAARMQVLSRTRTLDVFLAELDTPTLALTLRAVFDAATEISGKIRTASCDSQCCFNTIGGEEQLAIDLLANQVRTSGLAALLRALRTQLPFPPPFR
jgi:hypothetical protein